MVHMDNTKHKTKIVSNSQSGTKAFAVQCTCLHPHQVVGGPRAWFAKRSDAERVAREHVR